MPYVRNVSTEDVLSDAEFKILAKCPYPDICCFRKMNKCTILSDTKFWDNECHFRKASPHDVNLYDEARKARKKKGDK